jgi:hypothetical protein
MQIADDAAVWNAAMQAASEGDFKAYRNTFPSGAHVAEARRRIDEFAQARSAGQPLLAGGLLPAAGRHTDGAARAPTASVDTRAPIADDDRAWNTAMLAGDEDAFKAYQKAFPNGAHLAEARRVIDELSQTRGTEAMRRIDELARADKLVEDEQA